MQQRLHRRQASDDPLAEIHDEEATITSKVDQVGTVIQAAGQPVMADFR